MENFLHVVIRFILKKIWINLKHSNFPPKTSTSSTQQPRSNEEEKKKQPQFHSRHNEFIFPTAKPWVSPSPLCHTPPGVFCPCQKWNQNYTWTWLGLELVAGGRREPHCFRIQFSAGIRFFRIIQPPCPTPFWRNSEVILEPGDDNKYFYLLL